MGAISGTTVWDSIIHTDKVIAIGHQKMKYESRN